MESTQPIKDPSTEDKSKGPWIRYRVEHRSRETNGLISLRDTEGPNLDSETNKKPNDAAFMLVTIYRIAERLLSTNRPHANSLTQTQPLPTSTTPPSYALHIISPSLANALRSVVQYYPSQDLTGDIVIHWPYPVLVHHYDELAEFRTKVALKNEEELCDMEKGACEDIDLLLQYLDSSVMLDVLEEKKRNAKGVHTFEHAWVLLKPGTTLLDTYRDSVEFHPSVIHSVTGGAFSYPSQEWKITHWDMRYDGQYLGRCKQITEIAKFDGQCDHKHLIAGDLKDGTSLSEHVSNQLQYGKTYWDLLRKQCRQYKGKTQDFLAKEVNGLVMTDMKSYYEFTNRALNLMEQEDCRNWTSDCKCQVCRNKAAEEKESNKMPSLFADYNYIALESTSTLTPHQYFLCHFEMPAFVFKTRTWETLHVRDFTEPRFDEDMIDHLVMEPQRKRMLKALAKSFARIDRNEEALKGEPWTADFVQGKGHGLIFLLHGRPGVGKTCTAECIAAFTKRPLMVLTSSDIGTNPAQVEINLTRHFKTARAWGAVLLIDEADVFMERRSTADLVRNSLVAGFLRALEFYDGILFLTTNRVGSFDDAFISRIHIQLYYRDFDDDQRRQIWQTFIDKLAKERGNYMRLNIDAKDYIRGNDIRALKWNGREIRNAFQTAVSLAEYDAEKGEDGKIVITDEHLRAVVELSKDFKSYLNELHKGDEGKRAERKYERLDSYDNS
ncbi:P-loop containing nucleoside triphosphate hydrolase protein [Nemania diffusa]|nr:P-loop containing nucleoside triphosphate hydrolase protein [Nemania diffusa]